MKAKKAKTPPPAHRSTEYWILVTSHEPPFFTNVLLAFEHHWNQVVGFLTGDGWYETSADDHNCKTKSQPTWWAPIPQVPHYKKAERKCCDP